MASTLVDDVAGGLQRAFADHDEQVEV